jgi:hypothetical protein
MRIKEDFSYISSTEQRAIDDGLARLYVYSIRLDRFFTDEEKHENARQAEILTREQWAQRCDAIARKIGAQNLQAMEQLAKVFDFGQFSEISGRGDFWFWCNRENGADLLDYITLTTQGTTADDKNAKAEQAREILAKVNTENNIAYFQYGAEIDAGKLHAVAEQYASATAGAFVKYGFYVGKIKRIDEKTNGGARWAFMKKGAKTKGYILDDLKIYSIMLQNK